jgi:hypothetical protein
MNNDENSKNSEFSYVAVGVALFSEFLLFLGFYYVFSDFVIDKNYYFKYIVTSDEHNLSEKYGLKGMGMILLSMHPLLPSLVSRILMGLDNLTLLNVKCSPAILYYGFLFFTLFMLSTEYDARGMQLQMFAVLLLTTIFYSAKQLANFCKENHVEISKTIVSLALVFLCLSFTTFGFVSFRKFQCFDFVENDENMTYYLLIYLVYLINHWDSPSLVVFFGETGLVHSLMTINPYAASLLIFYSLIFDLFFNYENNLDYRYFFISTLQEKQQKIVFLGNDDKKYPANTLVFWLSISLKILPVFIIAWIGYIPSDDSLINNTSCGAIKNWSYLLFFLFSIYSVMFSLFTVALISIGCYYV